MTAREALVSGNGGNELTVIAELCKLLKIAGPMFIGRVSWVIMKVTDSAVLGHVGSRFLDNAALSDLWTSSSGVFISFGPTGTFCGQAFGAGNKKLVGVYAQIGLAVLLCTMIPVAVLWLLTGPFLSAVGATATESSDAGYYASVLAMCLPVRIFFSQLSAFFSSQKIMKPGAICATSAMLMNLFGTLVLVLGLSIPNWNGFGFRACPVVTTSVEYIQLFLLWFVFCFWKKLHLECWSGWSLEEITRERVVPYVKMYVPSALSIASDFWRVAAIGAVARTMSPDDLGTFNITYRVCWICLTFVGSLAGAVGIQLNVALGKGSVSEAKQSIRVGLLFCSLVLAALGLFMVCVPRTLGSVFSEDEKILDLFAENRWAMMAFTVLMNFAVCLELVPRAAGRVNEIFIGGLVGSWGGQVPGVIILTQFWRNDLTGLLVGASVGYAILCVLYAWIIIRINWDDVVKEAAVRTEKKKNEEKEKETPQGISLEPQAQEDSANGTSSHAAAGNEEPAGP